ALRAPFYGVTHPERAAVALSLYCRHEGARTPPGRGDIVAMLSEEEKKRAIDIGLALRFAAAVAPKAPQAIRRCSLRRDRYKLVFAAPADIKPLMDETPRKRLDALAAALGLTAVAEYDG
ncbi:MAG: hypothetical protein ACOZAA_11975, partial [Pseudomonadota bacterium]